MLNIKILGPGCFKCHALEQAAAMALEEIAKEFPDLEATLEHIKDYLEIERYPVLLTPALVINEQVLCSGQIPRKEKIIDWYRQALSQSA